MKTVTNKSMIAAGLLAGFSAMGAAAAPTASDAITEAFFAGGTTDPSAIIAQDDFFVDFVDNNDNGVVDAGDSFVGVIQLFNFRPAGAFDASSDVIDDVTPVGGSIGFDTGLYGVFDVTIAAAPGGQYAFSADSGAVTFYETDAPLGTIGTDFASDVAAISSATGSTVVAVADFSGGGSTFWDVDVTGTPIVDAFDLSLNFSSNTGLTVQPIAENELGTELFGTIGDTDNFFFLPASTAVVPGDTPFGSGYYAGGDGDFAIVVAPTPTAAGAAILGLAMVGVRRRRAAKA